MKAEYEILPELSAAIMRGDILSDKMTLREYFACQSLKGLLASGGDYYTSSVNGPPTHLTNRAVRLADALLLALECTK